MFIVTNSKTITPVTIPQYRNAFVILDSTVSDDIHFKENKLHRISSLLDDSLQETVECCGYMPIYISETQQKQICFYVQSKRDKRIPHVGLEKIFVNIFNSCKVGGLKLDKKEIISIMNIFYGRFRPDGEKREKNDSSLSNSSDAEMKEHCYYSKTEIQMLYDIVIRKEHQFNNFLKIHNEIESNSLIQQWLKDYVSELPGPDLRKKCETLFTEEGESEIIRLQYESQPSFQYPESIKNKLIDEERPVKRQKIIYQHTMELHKNREIVDRVYVVSSILDDIIESACVDKFDLDMIFM